MGQTDSKETQERSILDLAHLANPYGDIEVLKRFGIDISGTKKPLKIDTSKLYPANSCNREERVIKQRSWVNEHLNKHTSINCSVLYHYNKPYEEDR